MSEEKNCSHSNTIFDRDIEICTDCGEELLSKFIQNDIKFISDPNNIQIRKSEERTIFKDVESLGFNEKIVTIANELYMNVTGDKIFRGDSRKGIVFACIFYSFKKCDNPQSYDKLIRLFNLTKKVGSKGIKHINLHISKNSDLKTTSISVNTIISEIMSKFNATSDQVDEVIAIYEKIKNKSSQLNRCRPQSLASALVFFWISKRNNDTISIKKFIDIVNLSEMTINKIIKEINTLLAS